MLFTFQENLDRTIIFKTPTLSRRHSKVASSVHTSVGIVGRHLRTFQDYLKAALIEERNFKNTIEKFLHVLRFIVHQGSGVTTFEKHYGRKPLQKLDKVMK